MMSSLFQSTRNTRALPVGNLRYIRSDYPGSLSDDEVRWMRDRHITTIVDLREKKEYEAKPCRLETETGFQYHHLPVTGGGDTPKSVEAVANTYLRMLDEQMDTIVSTILQADTNVLYFCGAGKDRTGVVSAVILKRLGVPDEVIIEDYLETKDNLLPFLTAYVQQHPEVDLEILLPNRERIRKVLDALSLAAAAPAE